VDDKELIRLTIKGIFSRQELLDLLVLKGGNALDLVYGGSGRASRDIDLSMDMDKPELPKEELESLVRAGLGDIFAAQGLTVFDCEFNEVPSTISPDLQSFWGGYRIFFKVISTETFHSREASRDRLQATSLKVGGKGRVQIDISRHEYCADKRSSMLDGSEVSVYSTDMIVAEKLRAICQQTDSYTDKTRKHKAARARDFFDIYNLFERGAFTEMTPSLASLTKAVFQAKMVDKDNLLLVSDDKEHHRLGYQTLVESIDRNTEVKPFDFYFEFVSDLLRQAHALWDE
jgi:predicted nucleotidyltransferase component of viral defense system